MFFKGTCREQFLSQKARIKIIWKPFRTPIDCMAAIFENICTYNSGFKRISVFVYFFHLFKILYKTNWKIEIAALLTTQSIAPNTLGKKIDRKIKFTVFYVLQSAPFSPVFCSEFEKRVRNPKQKGSNTHTNKISPQSG